MARRPFGSILKRKATYHVRFSWAGREIWRKGGPTRAIAAQKLAVAEGLLKAGNTLEVTLARAFGDANGERLTFREAWEKYREHANTKKKASTLASDARRFRVLDRAAWAGKFLAAIRPEEILRWIDARLAGGAAKPTVNRDLALASAVYRWALALGLVEVNPFRRVPRLSERGRGRETYLTAEESRSLTAAASPDFRPLLIAALSTGARKGELLALRWEAVDFARREILIRPENAKSGRSRRVPLTGALLAELEALRSAMKTVPMNESPRVFLQRNGKPATETTVRDAFERAVRFSEIPAEKKATLRFHDLRHTCASLLAAAGVPILDIARLLGHSNVAVTMRYSHFMPESGRAAVEKLDGALGLSSLRPSINASSGG